MEEMKWFSSAMLGLIAANNLELEFVGTLPDGYLRTSPLPRIDKYPRVSRGCRDHSELPYSQPLPTATICV